MHRRRGQECGRLSPGALEPCKLTELNVALSSVVTLIAIYGGGYS
jgi:hypothetical protein